MDSRKGTRTVGFLSAAEQSLAADGAIACFSSNLFLQLEADRAPQLKAVVGRTTFRRTHIKNDAFIY